MSKPKPERPDDLWLTEVESHLTATNLGVLEYGHLPYHALGVSDKYEQATPWEPFMYDPSYNSMVWKARFTPKPSDLEEIVQAGKISTDDFIDTLLLENRRLRSELERLKKEQEKE